MNIVVIFIVFGICQFVEEFFVDKYFGEYVFMVLNVIFFGVRLDIEIIKILKLFFFNCDGYWDGKVIKYIYFIFNQWILFLGKSFFECDFD